MFDYARYEYLLASTQLALAMLGMGALLAPRDLLEVFRRPRGLAVGLVAQWIFVPLAAALVARLLSLEAGIAAGLVLIAAVPGGTMSNLVTYLGRGHIALSIALTSICSIAALVTAPLILRGLIGEHLPPDFQMPVGRVASEIGTALLAPLFVGMAFGVRFPAYRDVFSRWAIRASLFAIVLIVIGAGSSDRLDFAGRGLAAIGAIPLFAIVIQCVSFGFAASAGLPSPQRLAVAVEVTVRNSNLALLLKASLFPAVSGEVDPIGDGVLFVSLLYGGFAMFLAVPIVVWHRQRTPAEAVEGPGAKA